MVTIRDSAIRLRHLRYTGGAIDGIAGIAPIYKVSLHGEARLIGTGFWVTEKGHLVTAWHVIEDNIGEDGIDEGPIYAMQILPNRTTIPRVLRKSQRHKTFDLALSETRAPDDDAVPTWSFSLTLDEPNIGDAVGTYSFVSADQTFSGESYDGVSTDRFNGVLAIPDLKLTYELSFVARVNRGYVTDIFERARDSVMLPFPCFQSDIPIYGGNSGGPVFDKVGRVCGVNCTSYQGEQIAFHAALKGVLDLWARDIALIPEDPVPRNRTLLELGLADRVPFDPPLAKVFFTLPQRFIIIPYHWMLYAYAWIRWKFLKNSGDT